VDWKMQLPSHKEEPRSKMGATSNPKQLSTHL
jgi:hypothetical protein